MLETAWQDQISCALGGEKPAFLPSKATTPSDHHP